MLEPKFQLGYPAVRMVHIISVQQPRFVIQYLIVDCTVYAIRRICHTWTQPMHVDLVHRTVLYLP